MISFVNFYRTVGRLVKQEADSNPYSLGTHQDVLLTYNLKIRMLYESHPRKFTELRSITVEATGDPATEPPVSLITFDGQDMSGRAAEPWPEAAVIEWLKTNNSNAFIPAAAGDPLGNVFMDAHNRLRFADELRENDVLHIYGTFYPAEFTPLDPTDPTIMIPERKSIVVDYLRYMCAEEIFTINQITPAESFYRAMQQTAQTFLMMKDVFRQQTVALAFQSPKFGR